jgi:prepilin signal peptidase PulO-like enzyme (type II secretory pathway)
VEIYLQIIIFALGLCCGSFVNMLIYRTAVRYKLRRSKVLNSKESEKRSVCDFCGKQLSWFDNIPVVSWLLLRGKSRCCGKKLPISYPLVEIGTGTLFLLSQNNWVGMAVITLLMFSAVFDLKYMILPDFSSYILIGIAVVSLVGKADWWQNVVAGLVAFSLFWLLSKLKIKGQQAMGDGDAPLAGFMGLWLGWPLSVVAFYAAFIIGAIVGGGMMLTKKKRGDSQIPFGPFLILGTMIAWWGGTIIIKFLMTKF